MPRRRPICDTTSAGDRRSLDDEEAQRHASPTGGTTRLGTGITYPTGYRAARPGKDFPLRRDQGTVRWAPRSPGSRRGGDYLNRMTHRSTGSARAHRSLPRDAGATRLIEWVAPREPIQEREATPLVVPDIALGLVVAPGEEALPDPSNGPSIVSGYVGRAVLALSRRRRVRNRPAPRLRRCSPPAGRRTGTRGRTPCRDRS